MSEKLYLVKWGENHEQYLYHTIPGIVKYAESKNREIEKLELVHSEMEPIKITIKSKPIDLIPEFRKACLNLDYILDVSGFIVSQWIKDCLYFDGDRNIMVKPYWAKYYCKRGGYNKHDFIAFQYAGYQLKQALEDGLIELEITSGDNHYVPCWPKNKPAKGKDLKSIIKNAKHSWAYWQSGIKESCTVLNKCDCRPGHIKICCLCNKDDLMVLRKI